MHLPRPIKYVIMRDDYLAESPVYCFKYENEKELLCPEKVVQGGASTYTLGAQSLL